MNVKLIAYTPQPEIVVAAAAKLCYSNVDVDHLLEGLDEENSRKFLQKLMSVGHQSPLEHACFTFAIEGVSRALLAQITRHRIASFSVQSQRYVQLDQFEYVTPPQVAQQPKTKELFEKAMAAEAALYEEIAAELCEKHKEALQNEGMSEKEAAQKAKKMAIEDARFLLPNACTTKMIVTMNARSLLNFFHLRCCERAQWEIHLLADEMLKLVLPKAPGLFAKAGPGCAFAGCTEGAMSCGKAKQVRTRYEKMHEIAKEEAMV